MKRKRTSTRRRRTRKSQRGGGSKPWAILQYDDRPLSLPYQQLAIRNQQYASKHGYTYLFSDKSMDFPPYWRKVKLALDILETNKYKGVLWLDTDATIHSMEKSLDSFVKPRKAFYFASDPPKWDAPFNAGVWFVLANPMGKRILREWFACYNPSNWSKTADGKWTTQGQWAGDVYEQGAFTKKILPAHTADVERLDWTVLQGETPSATAFTLHFTGTEKEIRITNYLQSHLQARNKS